MLIGVMAALLAALVVKREGLVDRMEVRLEVQLVALVVK